MKLLPGDDFVIESPMSPRMVNSQLRGMLGEANAFSLGGGTFTGEIREDGFTLARCGWLRNSGRPLLEGRLCPGERGTRVEIHARLKTGVELVACLIMAMMVVFFVIVALDVSGGERLQVLAMLALMAVFLRGLLFIPYRFELERTQKLLTDVLDG